MNTSLELQATTHGSRFGETGYPRAAVLTGPLVSAELIAGELGVPKSWVYRQARLGKIPSVRLGKYVRFRWDDVVAALDKVED